MNNTAFKNVPWAEILRILRWHLTVKLRVHHQCLEQEEKSAVPGGFSLSTLGDLKRSLCAYSGLRGFLGYHPATKIEKEALNTLEEARRPPSLPPSDEGGGTAQW